MKSASVIVTMFTLIASSVSGFAAEEVPGREFTATAEVTSSQGTRRMSATLKVTRFTPIDDAKRLAEIVNLGGQEALAKALRGR